MSTAPTDAAAPTAAADRGAGPAVVTRRVDGAVVLALVGDHDLSTATAVRRAVVDAVGGDAGRVVVDLTRCTFVDSAVLGELVTGYRAAARRAQPFVLVATSEAVLRVLRMTGLDRMWPVLPSVAAALGAALPVDA